MRKTKKILQIVFMMMLIISFSACGSNNDTDSETIPSDNEKITEGAEIISDEIKATPISGECGTGLTYNLTEDGTLTINGSGSMKHYDYDSSGDIPTVDTPWFEQKDNIKKVVVEDGVTGLSPHSFYRCKNLEEVRLPADINKLDTCVFAYCENLKTINIPENCTSIGRVAFQGCMSLEEITLPETLRYLNQGAFQGCTSLKTIVIPNGIKSIIRDTFWYCESLENVVIPSTVTEIGEYAFADCDMLKEIVIPSGVQAIRYNAFFRCKGLEKITIPLSVTSMEDGIFEECENVTIITSSGSVAETYASRAGLKVQTINE